MIGNSEGNANTAYLFLIENIPQLRPINICLAMKLFPNIQNVKEIHFVNSSILREYWQS